MTLPENCLIKHIIDVKPADLESVITDVKPREFFKAIYLNELDNFKAYGLYVNDTLKIEVTNGDIFTPLCGCVGWVRINPDIEPIILN